MIVIHQQDSMYIRLVGRRNTWKGNNGTFGWSHTAPPLITNNVNILLQCIETCIKLNTYEEGY
jgi:hypothetical protein